MNKIKSIFKTIAAVLGVILFLVSDLLLFSYIWVASKWGNLTFDEIVFTITSPIVGTASNMVSSWILRALIPAIAVLALFVLLIWKNRKVKRFYIPVLWILSVVFLTFTMTSAWGRFSIGDYLAGMHGEASYVKANYKDASKVKLTFPEKKRNLIYIFCESMEVTYSDVENGGIYEENTIPLLTELTKEGENFSGNDDKLNGAISLTGSTYTAGAMTAMTNGLPLQRNLELSRINDIFPGTLSIGDILKNNGYQNELLIGSDAVFGGRASYFSMHGDYKLADYYYAMQAGYIPSDYYVWWGYEDDKLFEFAKEELKTLSSSDQPFNLTMLTVDTHFEDGYHCPDCSNEFSDDYRNVIKCSDKKIVEFIKWLEQQDFYEDTAVVIVGDHPTMDSSTCKEIPEEYQREVYTLFLNSAVEPEDASRKRIYSTMDMFPTTLAAMGVEIEGDKMAMGTNLFSSKNTLLEESGVEELNRELMNAMEFFTSLEYDESIVNNDQIAIRTLYDPVNDSLQINTLVGNERLKWKSFSVTVDDGNGHSTGGEIEIKQAPEPSVIEFNVSDMGETLNLHFTAVQEDDSELNVRDLVKTKSQLLVERDIYTYISYLQSLDNITILAASSGDIGSGINDEIADGLKSLGLSADKLFEHNVTYAAIIEGDNTKESFEKGSIELRSTLKCGLPVYLLGDWNYSWSQAAIDIDEEEFSQDRRGLSLVVCNTDTGEVISAASFDITFPSECQIDIYSYNQEANNATVSVYDVDDNNCKIQYGYVICSDKNDPEISYESRLELYDGSENTLFGYAELHDLKPEDTIMRFYYVGEDAAVYFAGEKDGNVLIQTE